MKNKDLLNICYKFFNRFITVNELIANLKKLDLNKLSNEEKKEIKDLIKGIEDLAKKYPNKIDDYVIKKKEAIEEIIEKLDQATEDEELNKQVKNLKKDYKKEIDSHERWYAVTDYINNNKYFNTCFDNLTKYELLEFIAQYICAPFPPQLKQNEFDELVKVGIEKDEREWLWRLAFNYETRDINFDEIVDYFIKMKDGYYLAELVSAIGSTLDIDQLIDKINDKDLIKDLKERKDVMGHFVNEKQFEKLFKKL